MDHEASLGRVSEGVDDLLGVDAGALSDDELSDAVVELQRQSERLAAARAALISTWDARQSWAADGARTGAAWLAAKCRMSKATARREIRRARALRHMPRVSEGLADGDIGVDHLDALSRVRRDHLADCFARAERQLVGHAKRLPFHHFHKAVRYWEQLADPDGVEDRAAKRYADRGAHLSKTFDGTQALDALFDVVGGAEFASVFDSIEKELFDADWAEAKAKYGDDVSLDKLARTPAQRRADTLVEMARRAATTPKDGQRPGSSPASSSTSTPSGTASANSPTAPCSPPAKPPASSPAPTSNASCSTPPHASSTSAPNNASSPAPPAAPSNSATANAGTTPATNPPNTATSTTSDASNTAAPPSKPTAAPPAPTTTPDAADPKHPADPEPPYGAVRGADPLPR